MGKRHFVFYNPPVVNRQLGIRKGVIPETRAIASMLLKCGIQTITFARSRLTVEVLTKYLKDLVRDPLGNAGRVRGYRGGYLPTQRREIERGLRAGAIDAVVSTNSRMSRHFLTRLGVPEERLFTVLGGVDTARFHASSVSRTTARASFGFEPCDFVLGIVGRMDEVKGIRESIRALAAARKSWPAGGRLRLLVIGFDSQYSVNDVNTWSEEAGLGPLDSPGAAVVVSGRVAQPEHAINALDMGVIASLGSETIARAALEIMACGVPLVGSAVGVMPDILPQELLFAPGDVSEMSRLMLRAGNAAWLDAVRKTCHERIFCGAVPPVPGIRPSGGLTLENFRDQTLAVYASALKRAGLTEGEPL